MGHTAAVPIGLCTRCGGSGAILARTDFTGTVFTGAFVTLVAIGALRTIFARTLGTHFSVLTRLIAAVMIAAGTIIAILIAAGTFVTILIAAGTFVTILIAAGAIIAILIAAGTIIAILIAAGTFVTILIAAGAIIPIWAWLLIAAIIWPIRLWTRVAWCFEFTVAVTLVTVAVKTLVVLVAIVLAGTIWIGFFVPRTAFGQHAEIMVGELKVIFGEHAVAWLLRVTRKCFIFFEQLRRVSTRTIVDAVAHFGPSVLLTLAILAAPAATATGLLTIVDQADAVLNKE
jgi:hypothetical protein